MKTTKRVLAILLTIISVFGIFSVAVGAANYSPNYKAYSQPNTSSDYAYWNGSKVCKSSGTTKSEIQWMQAALNSCIVNKKISTTNLKAYNASQLDVDGSFGPASTRTTKAFQKQFNLSVDGKFGPATIKKMISVLNPTTQPQPSKSQTSKYNLIWPTKNTTIVGKYGTNGSKRSDGTRYHTGIDIRAEKGDPCYAVADGTVVMCKSSDDASGSIGGRGRYIVIYHSNGDYSSLYEHLNSCSVKVGDTVKAGEKIGTTGNSGWLSKGRHYDAHLHFGLMNGKMTSTGYDLWTVPGKKYNGKTYTNHTFDPDPRYNKNVTYTYK
ncbi:MAG: peptidoglycan DD-metalloendopeptidase family protein [Acutalibacteraceae bacterium]